METFSCHAHWRRCMKFSNLWDTNWSPNPGQKNRPSDSLKKKENLLNSGLCRPGESQNENQRKLKERQIPRHHQITKKKLWKMKVTVTPIVICAIGTIPKGLVRGLEELEIERRAETNQTTALLRSERILRWVLGTCGDLLSFTPVKDRQLTLMWTICKKQ